MGDNTTTNDTRIQVTTDLRDRLKELKRQGESYECYLRRSLEGVEER